MIHNKKLVRSQKHIHKAKIDKEVKRRFMAGDTVIVISGDYKNAISKVIKQEGNHCYLELTREPASYLQKAMNKHRVGALNVKIHQSNLMHYDPQALIRTKVKHHYDIQTNPNSHKPNKIKIRTYLKSGIQVPLIFKKKIDATQESATSAQEQQSSASDQDNNN